MTADIDVLVTCNATPPVETRVALPDDMRLPEIDWKYAPIDLVRETACPLVQAVLDQAPIRGQHRHVLVDVKVQNLRPELCSCIPGWHLDGPGLPNHPSRPEIHHLFVYGGAPTEFVCESLLLPCRDWMTPKNFASQVPAWVSARPIVVGTINTFTRFDFHRGVHADRPLTRLLIRVTETDVIRPVKRPVKPGVGARP